MKTIFILVLGVIGGGMGTHYWESHENQTTPKKRLVFYQSDLKVIGHIASSLAERSDGSNGLTFDGKQLTPGIAACNAGGCAGSDL